MKNLWWIVCVVLGACAGSRQVEEASGRGESAPCAGCRSDEAIALDVSIAGAYREWGVDSLRLLAGETIGVLPVLRMDASGPDDCKICHSFSVDAVDFDFSAVQDSVLRERFDGLSFEVMYPGLQVPERDSTWLSTALDSLRMSDFVDGIQFGDAKPWTERSGEQRYDRKVPGHLRMQLGKLAGRYAVRYLVVPVLLNVELKPEVGKRGGFVWESLWTLWDARQGKLIMLDYYAFTAKTTGAAPPDRQWSAEWARRIGQALAQGVKSEERR